MSSTGKKTKMTVGPFRVSFPHLFEPHSAPDSDREHYELTLLLPPGTDLKPFRKLALSAARGMFEGATWDKRSGNIKAKIGNKTKTLKNPIRSNEEKCDDYPESFEEDGHHVIARSGTKRPRPKVVDAKLKEITDPRRVYGGVWVMASISAYAWNHKTGGPGVSFSLEAVQVVKDDEPFGEGGVDVEDVFEPVDTDDYDDDDLDDDEDDDLDDLFE